VVVNHHLLCADLALKEQGFGELLPSAGGYVIDEAHQLPEVAAQFFGKKLSSRQLLDLARDTVGELERMTLLLGALTDTLKEVAERGKGLESCYKRALQQSEVLARFVEPPPDDQWIHWYETYRNGFALNRTPITVAAPFQRAMQETDAGWVFTSATLSVGGDFSHFREQLGLDHTDELLVDSPFNYRRNALLYLPEGLPEPQHAGYSSAVMETVLPVLEASAGRAFLLFTSHRALQEAKRWLQHRIDFPTFVQGDMPKRELLEAFQSVGNAVLLGTSSFWEGVDVRGEALSLVVIDKLPFGSPGDPVTSARIEHMKANGGNPFFEFQVPQAAIALKQGVGRLIRDVTDRGVLVICDPRMRTRNYGEAGDRGRDQHG